MKSCFGPLLLLFSKMRPSLVLDLAVHTAIWSASAVQALDASVTQVIDAFLANHPIVTKSAASASQSSDAAVQRNSILQGNWSSSLPNMTASLCPDICSSTALDSSAWPVYHSINRLKACNKTMLMDFTLFNNLSNPDTHISIAACVADLSDSLSAVTNSSSTSTLCLPDTNTNNTRTVTASPELAWASATASSAKAEEVVSALQELRALSLLHSSGCNEIIKFALLRQTAVGLYVGSGLASQGILPGVLEKLADRVQSDGVSQSFSFQLCNLDGLSSRYSLGIMAQTGGDLAAVQHVVQTWKNSSCISISEAQTVSDWQNITFQAPLESTESANVSRKRSRLQARNTCTTVQVVLGDTCPSLATGCGITGDEFDEYNSDVDCSNLPVGSYMCCSGGELPDYSPQPDSDDNCYVYLVQTGDTCSSIAAAYGLMVADIGNYNNDTWGWMGCDDLLANMNIYLSTGWPPMLTMIANAVCRPQMNNTPTAPYGTNLSTLNECPLNACCDI
jgi:chitinase